MIRCGFVPEFVVPFYFTRDHCGASEPIPTTGTANLVPLLKLA